jgi:hypothetical protein
LRGATHSSHLSGSGQALDTFPITRVWWFLETAPQVPNHPVKWSEEICSKILIHKPAGVEFIHLSQYRGAVIQRGTDPFLCSFNLRLCLVYLSIIPKFRYNEKKVVQLEDSRVNFKTWQKLKRSKTCIMVKNKILRLVVKVIMIKKGQLGKYW